MSSVIESKRTILDLIVSTSFQLVVGAGIGKVLVSDVAGIATWQDVIPVGTKMVFYQASAPLGWTAVALNDYFLRVVTAGGSGGSAAGAWTLTLTGNHTHLITDHNHELEHLGVSSGWAYSVVTDGFHGSNTSMSKNKTVPAWTTTNEGDGGGSAPGTSVTEAASLGGIAGNMTAALSTGNQSAQSTAVHTAAQHKYADIIICTKN